MSAIDPSAADPVPHRAVASLLEIAGDWLGARPLGEVVQRDALVARLDAALSRERVERWVDERFHAEWEKGLARLRAEARPLAEMLGKDIAAAAVRAAGDAEPDERALRAFFGERAVEKLLASLIYDGIVEFLKKGLNPVGERVGGLFGGLGPAGGFAKRLAGIAGGAASLLGDQLETQVKSFLAVFAKVAVDRAVAYVTAPENKPAFREMRERAVRRALETPVRDHVARVSPEQAAKAEARVREAILALARDEAARQRARAAIGRFFDRHGAKTLRALAEETRAVRPSGRPPPPDELVRLVARLLADDAVVAWFAANYPLDAASKQPEVRP